MKGKNPKGAGRKPISKKYSDALKKDVHSALTRKAQETGKTFGDILVGVIYDDDNPNSPIRAGAFKIVQEILLIRETQNSSDITVSKHEGPAICLPPLVDRPIPKPVKQEKEGEPLH